MIQGTKEIRNWDVKQGIVELNKNMKVEEARRLITIILPRFST